MSEWKAFGSRISLFPAMPPASPVPSALDLYRRIWGDPDSFQKQPNAFIPTLAHGKRGRLQINCVAQPGRIDFNFSAMPTQVPQMTVDLIDDPTELRNELEHIIGLLDEGFVSNSISRVALGLQFLNLKLSQAEANKAVTEIIPDVYRVKITDEEDFIFQINRPRMDEDFRDIRINFLTKWSVERFQILTIPVPIAGVPAGMPLPVPQPTTVISASVAFDNNNIPTRPLSSKEQSALLRKTFHAAAEMQREIGLNIEGF